jgi:predicted ATP-binding protein involved in virulence
MFIFFLAKNAVLLIFYTFSILNIVTIMDSISIVKHEISNLGGFEGTRSIDFKENLPSVILGINGSGKSSLLNSIYSSIIAALAGLVHFDKSITNLSSSTIHTAKTQSDSLSKVKILQSGTDSVYEIGLSCQINGRVSIIGESLHDIRKGVKTSFTNSQEALPIFRFFQAEKHIVNEQSIVQKQSFNQVNQRILGYNKHTSNELAIQEVTNFIITQINIENQEKISKKDFDYSTPIGNYIQETLNLFTTTLYGEEVNVSVGASKYSNGQSLVITKKDTKLEFIQLSSGEKYAISVILELIYRNTILNPEVENYKITPGIVLIDEIESHLHPRWQLTIIKALQLCFPKVQFIVSSHSPLVASSVRRNQIIALSNFEVIPSEQLPNIFGGTSDEMLEKILFSDIQINDFDQERNEINSLLKKFNFDKAEEKLNLLKQTLHASPKWIRDYERKIKFGKS